MSSWIARQLQGSVEARRGQYARYGACSDVPEVRSVLGMLPRHAAAAGPLNAQAVGNILRRA
jgi:hypothetical protein